MTDATAVVSLLRQEKVVTAVVSLPGQDEGCHSCCFFTWALGRSCHSCCTYLYLARMKDATAVVSLLRQEEVVTAVVSLPGATL
jgi:hypothetical protein